MRFDTKFSCGDQAWGFDGGRCIQLTIGQIRIEYTKSEGVNDGAVEPGCGIQFDNYKAHDEKYQEAYMCVETGIHSGRIYTFGEHIFATREECEQANAKVIARLAQEERERKEWDRKNLLSEEADLRRRLARIEAIKSQQPEAA